MNTRADRGHDPGQRPVLVAILALMLLAILVRTVPYWAGVVEGGRAIITDPDACYHARRAALIARNFPDLALYDTYVNYPEGGRIIWPPLYDLVLAALISLSPGTGPGVATVVALLPPLLFALTVLVLFLIARHLWPRRPLLQLIAAAIPVLLPATFPYTAIARIDHHAAELLVFAVFLLTLGTALDRVRNGARAARAAILPAITLAAALATQLSLVLLIPLAIASLVLVAPRRGWSLGAWIFGLAILPLLPFSLAYHARGAPIRHFQFGLFQPALLAGAALLSMIPGILLGGRSRRRLLLSILLAVPLATLAAHLAAEATGGISYLARSFAPWQESIGESQSVFANGLVAGLAEMFIQLSGLVVILPVACVLLARRAAAPTAHRAVLLVSCILFAVIGSLQQRFLPHLALLIGMAAVTAGQPLVTPSARGPRAALAAAILVAALLTTFPGWIRTQETTTAFERARSVLDYLAEETPPTSHYDDPRETPEYGVVAEWSYGHYIQYYGRRPAVIDNFGDHAGDPARVRSFFLETDERRALATLDSLSARYVMVRDLADGFRGLIPDPATRERFIQSVGMARPGVASIRFSSAIDQTLLYRLAWRNGSGVPGVHGREVPPLARFRLVAESEEMEQVPGGPAVPHVKLYEVVSGARLRLEGRRPGEDALLLSAVSSPRGHVFPYVVRLKADISGTMEVIVPYPSVTAEGKSRFIECEIATRDRRIAVPPIEESMVREGTALTFGADTGIPPAGR